MNIEVEARIANEIGELVTMNHLDIYYLAFINQFLL